MVVHTTNGRYEVHQHERRYRRLAEVPGALPEEWCGYERMTPVRTGLPLIFFGTKAERGRVLHFNVVRTSPVTQILADSA